MFCDGKMAIERVADEDRRALERSHRVLGSQLRAITALIANNTGLSDLFQQLDNIDVVCSSDAKLESSSKSDDLLR
jgi:23S rRNA A1618 N6-methylase RlmF